MDKNSGSWFVVAAVGVFGVAAVLAYSLVAPTWDQGETSTLLAGLVGCPTIGVVIGLIFLGLHWRDERIAARHDKQTARRGRAIDRQGQDANVLGLNAAVTRQAIDVISAMAQAQARQAAAQLGGLRTDNFMQRSIDAPAQEPSWFMGEWDYGLDTQADDETAGRIAYL